MKTNIISLTLLFTFTLNLHLLSASVPLRWPADTSRVQPAVFDVVLGETIALEATMQSGGKPFAMGPEPVCIFWQTNGMGSAWWTKPCVATASSPSGPANVISATFTPDMDPGTATVNGFLGSSGSIYRAAFTLRFRHSPGATPNALPLPTPVIDFAKVTVLNPPWSGGGGSGGVDTNAVLDIIHKTVEGEGRYLPPYLHYKEMDDTYPEAAAEWYAQADYSHGSCSARRSGNLLERNYDWNFNCMPEYVIRVGGTRSVASETGRFASLAVCNVGTNLTEDDVVSGKHLRWLKALPGHAVDGVNENGVVAEVNVVDGDPQWRSGVLTASDIHPLGAVRWALDNGTSAGMVASNLAARIKFPVGWTQNFHWMIADATSTWIVENGTASNVTEVAAKRVMTNFPILPDDYAGSGKERYQILRGGEPITNAWFTRAYSPLTSPAWLSDLTGLDTNLLFRSWAAKTKEAHRGESFDGQSWWQTVHTSVYDITNRTLRIAVQETDDWYTFAVPSAGGVKPEAVREIVEPMIGAATNGLRRVDDMAVYEKSSRWEIVGGTADWEPTDPQPQYDGLLWFWMGRRQGSVISVATDTTSGADAEELHFTVQSYGPFPSIYFSAAKATELVPTSDVLATSNGVDAAIATIATAAEEAKDAANEANVWSMATYNFMTGGRTNCWFSGTNYMFGADAETRQKFAWEDGMDAATVPCSMALWEIRDGARQLVWDQRDWPSWYWSFKAGQMATDIQGRIDALGNSVSNASNYAWSKRYASDGTPNPDASTTFIDTPSVTLSPGMKWETVATVSGAAYWTIVGNGAVIGGSGTNAVLRILDFEGNDIMTVTKGEHRLAWLESGEITDQMSDANGWICFDMLADAEPVGYFSTTLDSSDFLPQTDPNCPAQYSWENIGGGKWRVHFLLKPGIQSDACFAKFQVEVEGQTVIRYNAGQEISGGLIYNGVKIAPDVSGSPAVGTVIQWKVVR